MPLVTATLADVYIRQGHYAEAVAVLEALVQRSPGRSDLVARLASARDLLAQGSAEGAPDDGAAPPVDSTVALLRLLLDRVVRRRRPVAARLERAS